MKYLKKCRRLRKMATAGSNSLTIIGGLGILLLVLSQLIHLNQFEPIALIGQFMSLLGFAAVFFVAFITMVSNKSRDAFMLLMFLGSGGIVFGYLAQIARDQINDKPPVIHLAGIMLAAGIIMFINRAYYEDIRS